MFMFSCSFETKMRQNAPNSISIFFQGIPDPRHWGLCPQTLGEGREGGQGEGKEGEEKRRGSLRHCRWGIDAPVWTTVLLPSPLSSSSILVNCLTELHFAKLPQVIPSLAKVLQKRTFAYTADIFLSQNQHWRHQRSLLISHFFKLI